MAFLLPVIGAIGAAAGAVRTISSLVSGGQAAPPAGEPGVDVRLGTMTTLLQQIATELLPVNVTAEVRAAEPTLGVSALAENGMAGSAFMPPDQPFVGDITAPSQPTPDGMGSALDTPLQQGITTYDPTLYPGIDAGVSAPMDTGGGTLSLAGITGAIGNLVPELRGIIGAVTGGGAVAGVARAIPAIEKVIPSWLLRVGGGAAAASAIYQLYQRLRAAGASHPAAKRAALAAAGIRHRRRRMRPTNVRALRRAIRRIRGARRLFSKVRGLHIGGRGASFPRHRRRRMYRRGDLPPFLVEDTADMMDEAEDLGVDPSYFQEDEMSEWESAS